MLKHPLSIISVLLSIEVLILSLSRHERTKAWFDFLPPVFWIYFLPMLAATLGVVDPKSPLYQLVITHLLPASLVLLLLSVDVRAILRLGPVALLMFFIGAAGIMAGAGVSFFVFKHWVGVDFWSGFGALSASWTGGSANMIAVKEALGVPDRIFAPMVIVDTVVPYVWMGTLIALAGWQAAFDTWNRSDRTILDDLTRRSAAVPAREYQRNSFRMMVIIIVLAGLGSVGAQALANIMPQVKNVLSPYAWTIILVSLAGMALSFTPVKKLESYGSTKIGYWLLYFVLTAIGAKASIANVGSAVLLILAGFLIVAVHVVFLMLGARWLRAPLFLVAASSQANIGGVASAPVVAAVYQPGLASVGLLLAILGNIVGTYLGILCGQLCRMLS
ncbi:MAG: DUF819 family protein [Candidatus Omnitrophica bacterium]|nr:DUF819 family protein [Candidatus Omnitrophota bacterium]